jgi:hypothetical protein
MWRVYTDPIYSFSISYPPDFDFEVQHPGPPTNLQLYRAVDKKYLCGYPLGQTDMGVFTNDSSSLSAWVQKHSDVGTAEDTKFLIGVTDLKAVTVANRQAVTFQEVGVPELPPTIYVTAFSFGSGLIFLLDWWSYDPSYIPAIRGIAQAMLSSFIS